MSITTTDPAGNTGDELQTLAVAYRNDPTPEARSRILHLLKPSIDFGLTRFTGGSQDPVLRANAYALAASSLQNYNPESGANIRTYVVNNLQPLIRDRRKRNSTIRLPERAQLDLWSMDKAIREFEDQNGREPDEIELADFSGIPAKRVHKLMSARLRTPSEGMDFETPAAQENSVEDEAMFLLYASSNPFERKILHHQFGYGGKPVLTSRELAEKLKSNPAAISRAANKMAGRIQELETALAQ